MRMSRSLIEKQKASWESPRTKFYDEGKEDGLVCLEQNKHRRQIMLFTYHKGSESILWRRSPFKSRCLSTKTPAVHSRCFAMSALEVSGEMALICEAAEDGDFGYLEGRPGEQCCGPIETALP